MIRLGVNIDHVATVRQARGEAYPDPVQAAVSAEIGGASNITCHLREDRRHIQDRDVYALKDSIKVPLNFEMAATKEMLAIALKLKPHSVTLVPEKREERTTEGGLDLKNNGKKLAPFIEELQEKNILVSLFIEPEAQAVKLTKQLGAWAVEFHTGRFCHEIDAAVRTEQKMKLVDKLATVSVLAHESGLQSHFGHGLNYANAQWLQLVPYAEEANIGHAIVGRALFVGMTEAVRQMHALLNAPEFRPLEFKK